MQCKKKKDECDRNATRKRLLPGQAGDLAADGKKHAHGGRSRGTRGKKPGRGAVSRAETSRGGRRTSKTRTAESKKEWMRKKSRNACTQKRGRSRMAGRKGDEPRRNSQTKPVTQTMEKRTGGEGEKYVQGGKTKGSNHASKGHAGQKEKKVNPSGYPGHSRLRGPDHTLQGKN